MARQIFLQARGRSVTGSGLAHAALLVAAVLSTGCGFHLHNPADEARARKASARFTAADVGQFVASERAVVQAAHERDLAARRRNVTAERDALIIAALSEARTAGDLLTEVERRQLVLGLPSDPNDRLILYDLPLLLRSAMLRRDAYLVVVLAANAPIPAPSFPPTKEDEDAATKAAGNVLPTFRSYKTAADAYAQGLQLLSKIGSGELGRLNGLLKDAADLQTDVNKRIRAAKKQLEAAVADYKKLVEAGAAPFKDLEAARKRVEDALARFEKIVPKLEAAAKKAGMEDLLAAVRLEQLKAAEGQVSEFLDGFAKQSAGGEEGTAKPGVDKTEAAGRAAAILVKAAKTVRESSTRAKLVPLIFEQGRLKIEIARLQRKLERGGRRIALLERQRDQAIAEGLKLVDAHNMLTQAHAGNVSRTIEALMSGNTRGEVVHGILVLAESVGIHRLRREEIEVQLLTLDHDEALDASEFALDLWRHTIASPLDELVNYHASGLKPQDVAGLINAASLAGIAVGVN